MSSNSKVPDEKNTKEVDDWIRYLINVCNTAKFISSSLNQLQHRLVHSGRSSGKFQAEIDYSHLIQRYDTYLLISVNSD